MATTAQLVKSWTNGSEIRVQNANGTIGVRVEYSPRYKGDRQPWAHLEGRRTTYRYAAAKLTAVAKTAEQAPAEPLQTEYVTAAAYETLKSVGKAPEGAVFNPDRNAWSFQTTDSGIRSLMVALREANSR